jgi:gliding motility-associated-like protein
VFDEDDAVIDLDTMGSVGQGEQVTASLVVTPLPNTVDWNINGVDITATTTTITFNADEEMNVIIATFINSNGCEESDTLILATVPPSLEIPNAFSPNNDGNNDNFRILVKGNISIEQFLIFNRWGQLVYEGPVDDMEGWDGVFGNEPAESDTYVYTARIRYPNGREEVMKGDVTLVR